MAWRMGQALDPELEEHLEQAHGQIPASQADGRWRPSALVKRENPAARRALQQCRPGRQRQRRLLAFLSCRGHRESCVSWLPRDVARLICGLVPREALFVFGGRAMSESDDAAGEDGRMSLTAACWRLERGQWTRLGDAPQPFFGASVAVLPDGWMLLTSCVTFSAAGYATSARVLLTDGREHWEDVTAGTLARGEGCACACYGNSVVVLGGSNRRPDRRYRLVRETGCLGEHLRLPQRPNAQELTRVRCVLYGSFLIALSFNGGCGNDESQPETVSACDCCAALECIDLSDPAGDWFSLRKLPASRLHVTNCHLSVQGSRLYLSRCEAWTMYPWWEVRDVAVTLALDLTRMRWTVASDSDSADRVDRFLQDSDGADINLTIGQLPGKVIWSGMALNDMV